MPSEAGGVYERIYIDSAWFDDPGSAQWQLGIYCNFWIGSGDFFSEANWLDNPMNSPAAILAGSFGPFPDPDRETFIGPYRDDILTPIILPRVIKPVGPAVLSSHFTSPGLDMRSGANTELSLATGGLFTTNAQIGTVEANPHNSIPDTQPGWNAILNFNGGQIAGSWSFTDRSVVNINSDHTQAAGVWRGTIGSLNVAAGKTFTVTDSLPTLISLKNRGMIRFPSGGSTSSIQIFDNQNGIVEVEGGSSLYISNTSTTNTDGTIRLLRNSSLSIDALSVIDGGTLHGEEGSRFYYAGGSSDQGRLRNVTVSGEISAGQFASMGLSGTIENNGVLGTVSTENGGGYHVAESEVATLTGDGDIALRGGSHSVSGAGTLVNESNTIRGDGTISIAILENRGAIRPEAGFMLLQSTTINGDGGRVEVASDGSLGIDALSVIDGGTLHGEEGSRFYYTGGSSDQGRLRNVTVTGEILAGQFASMGLSGMIENNGVLGTVSTENGGGYHVGESEVATLTGDGDIALRGGSHSVSGAGTLVNESNTIRGDGTVSVATLENRGVIRPEGGTMYFQNGTMFSQSASGTTDLQGELQIANYAPGNGRLTGAGKLKGDADFAGMHVAPGSVWKTTLFFLPRLV